ncbi:sensor histidine kinase [Nonomuraea sp. NPDC050556]|uniref:sensor histidine kinase n=1 Tax=Nonomuraea sp. NPDC050556 TaxID=3364369 RepID=UPI00378C52D4
MRVLFRRWAGLILGGALLMPYMMAGVLIAGVSNGGDLLLPMQVPIYLASIPVIALTGLFLPVRAFEVSAAQGLFGAQVEPPRTKRTWQERRRTSAWFTLHLAIGGLVSGFTLAIVPFAIWTWTLPFFGNPSGVTGTHIDPGLGALPWSLAGLAFLVLLTFMAAGGGLLLAKTAPRLLGPTPAERLAAAEDQARTLAERNRLARELHDSVGHALSVVTLQAAAAGRILDRKEDPDPTVRGALTAIEQSARSALEDLDHVLGVLREGDGTRQPQATLADLDALITSSGAEVITDISDLSPVPAVVSREAYRIVQEALTNAIKHGEGPVRLAAAVRGEDLELQVSNRTAGANGHGGGRGIHGMRERVRLLRGDLEAGQADGQWMVSVRLPLRSGS